jgi:conjugative transfer signal peptidase TraF
MKMNMKTKKLWVFIIILCSLTVAIAYRTELRGIRIRIRINLSPSVPTGIWRILDAEESGDARSGYVVVKPNDHPGYRLAVERSYLNDLTPMLKCVAATEGDVVDYDEEERAITVNGSYIMMSEILSEDTEGRPLPRASFPVALKKGEVWLSSENIRGYDSRYFGPASADLLQRAEPVWKF